MKNSTKNLLPFLLFALFSIQTKAQFGNALSYDPANTQFTTMPSGIVSSIPNGTSFTIEAWVYWRGGSSYQRIFDFGNSTNDGYMYLTPSNGSNVAFGFAIPGHPERQISGGSMPLNTWTHVAVVVDYSQTDFFGHGPLGFLYINGVIANPSGGGLYDPGDPSFTAYNPAALADVSETNWLGHPRSIFDPYFNGIIDELRISNTVRYSANFTPPTAPFTLPDANTLALYHFDEGTGQTSADATTHFASAILGPTTSVESVDPSWVLSTLPVRIITFTGSEEDKSIHLKWTASTTNEHGQFVIERSADGQRFQSIGTVAISKSPGTFDYDFIDHSYTASKNFYRLRIEEDGATAKYSKVILLSKNIGYTVTPTLARDQVFVTVPKTTNVSIYNASGILIKKMRLTISQNVYLTGFTSGLYYLRFEDTRQTIPFTKL